MKISKKLYKVNNHPIGENSPNLVTLENGCLKFTCRVTKHFRGLVPSTNLFWKAFR
jgi:hypothetical protein